MTRSNAAGVEVRGKEEKRAVRRVLSTAPFFAKKVRWPGVEMESTGPPNCGKGDGNTISGTAGERQ